MGEPTLVEIGQCCKDFTIRSHSCRNIMLYYVYSLCDYQMYTIKCVIFFPFPLRMVTGRDECIRRKFRNITNFEIFCVLMYRKYLFHE